MVFLAVKMLKSSAFKKYNVERLYKDFKFLYSFKNKNKKTLDILKKCLRKTRNTTAMMS